MAILLRHPQLKALLASRTRPWRWVLAPEKMRASDECQSCPWKMLAQWSRAEGEHRDSTSQERPKRKKKKRGKRWLPWRGHGGKEREQSRKMVQPAESIQQAPGVCQSDASLRPTSVDQHPPQEVLAPCPQANPCCVLPVSPCAHWCFAGSSLWVCCWFAKPDILRACPSGAGPKSWDCPKWDSMIRYTRSSWGFEFPPDYGLHRVGVGVNVVYPPLLSYLFP